MPVFKQTWTFTSLNGAKWSEVYYDTAASLTETADITQVFINKRLTMLSRVNKLRQIRIVQTDAPRVTAPKVVNQNGTRVLAAIDAEPSTINESLVVGLVSTSTGLRRKLHLSGYCDGDAYRDTTTGEDKVSPEFNTLLKAWIKALADGGYVIYGLVKPLPNDPFDYSISKVNGTAGDGTSLLTFSAAAAGVLPGTRIILSGFDPKILPGLKGTFTVLSVTGAIVKVRYATPANADITPKRGRWRLAAYIQNGAIDPDASGWEYIGGHKRRNFTNNSRGARSAARLRR